MVMEVGMRRSDNKLNRTWRLHMGYGGEEEESRTTKVLLAWASWLVLVPFLLRDIEQVWSVRREEVAWTR